MRIALFSDTYLPTVNGVARTLGRLVSHLDREGHSVFLVTPRLGEAPADGAEQHVQVPGVPLPLYPELQACRLLGGGGSRLLERFNPDVVHVATEAPVGWSGRSWAMRRGVPLVTSFHTNFPEYLAGYGLGPMRGLLWRFLRHFHGAARLSLGPSVATLRELRSRGFHPRWRRWGRGVDARLFSPTRRHDSVRDEFAPGAEHVMVYVGRLAPEKRVDLLLDAYRRVRADLGDSVGLVIVGDGPAGPHLRASAPPGVCFTGYLSGVDLAEAFAAADVFAFPSDTETFGNVVLEALASGVPVVAPARGGVTDSVRPGHTGLLFPPKDAEAMAQACIKLLVDPALRRCMALNARALAVEAS